MYQRELHGMPHRRRPHHRLLYKERYGILLNESGEDQAHPKGRQELTKDYYIKKSLKFIKELKLYKNSLEYYKGITPTDKLPAAKHEELKRQIGSLSHRITAIEHALSFLSETEYEIIDRMYISDEMSAEEMCGEIPLERSSIYRYRKSALEKISLALFGRK